MTVEASIITPSFNSEKFISKCINSVLFQTFSNWEMIIIDDFSTDNSVRLIKDYCKKDSRIKLIVSEKNVGSGIARNLGIKNSKGRYIAFLDSDDYWSPTKLEKQITYMKLNNYVFTFTQYYEFDHTTKEIKTIVKSPRKVSYKMLLRNGGFIGCLTVIYDTNYFGKRYLPKIRKRQDWALWVKMLKEIDFAYGVLEPLAYYRLGNESLSKNKIKLLKYNFMVYRVVLRMSLIESIYRMFNFLLYYFFLRNEFRNKVIS